MTAAVTEDQWFTCANPETMLRFLYGQVRERKLRLAACACVRQVAHLLTDEHSRHALDTCERYADGLAGDEDLWAARDRLRTWIDESVWRVAGEGWRVAVAAALAAVGREAWRSALQAAERAAEAGARQSAFRHAGRALWDERRRGQCALLRDIFGNPFRTLVIDPAWRRWNEGLVPRLAQAIYDERRFDDLPVLGDALEEAGCTNQDVLAHCRGPGPHTRGCWILDGCLGKE